jgi:hypothetical protein
MQGDGRRPAKLVAQVERGLQQRLVEGCGQQIDLLARGCPRHGQGTGLLGDEASLA